MIKVLSQFIYIYIDKSELERKDHAKCLGTFFDKCLSWAKQIEYTNIKLRRGIDILKKLDNMYKKVLSKIHITLF